LALVASVIVADRNHWLGITPRPCIEGSDTRYALRIRIQRLLSRGQ